MRNRLPELRAARRWTQEELGRRLDVSRQTVISLEKGKYDPSLPLAFRIAAVFQCRIEDVFCPDGTEWSEGQSGCAPTDARGPATVT